MNSKIAIHVGMAAMLAAGCATQGTGTGEIRSKSKTSSGSESAEESVRFTWNSDGPSVSRGSMQARVPGHGVFSGKYMQVTSEVDAADVDPYFADSWYPGWDSWDGWGDPYDAAFVTHYSGVLLAVLRSGQGDSMRCRFRLAQPDRGPAGGGVGECQLSDGESVKYVTLEKD